MDPSTVAFMTTGTPHGTLSIEALRNRLGLTQEALAAKMGKPRSMVQGWETGEHQPGKKNRALLAKALGVEPDALGPAWNPEAPRKKRRRATGTPPEIGSVSGPTETLRRGDETPLFRQFAGLWQNLDASQQHEIYAVALRMLLESVTNGGSLRNLADALTPEKRAAFDDAMKAYAAEAVKRPRNSGV